MMTSSVRLGSLAVSLLLGACASTNGGFVVPEPEPWRAQAPEPGPPPEIEAPRLSSFALPNGIRVIVHQRPELPLVAMKVAIRGGSADEGAEQAGLAGMTYRLLTEGAGELDAVGLAEAFAELGTSVSAGVGDTGGTVGAMALTRHAPAVLGLLAQVVRAPTLDEGAFRRLQARQLANLKRLLGQPNHLAGVALREAVFGADHPYGYPSSGSPATVSALTVEACRAFWEGFAQPDNLAVVLVGAITEADARAWVTEHFGDWKGRGQVPVRAQPVPTTPRTEVLLVPKPGLEQTVIALGRPALAHSDPGEWALRVGVGAWGGTFGSRLNMNLREDKGYTYGARAYVQPQVGAGSLLAMTSVRADVTGPALREVMAELAGVQERPLTSDELAAARDALLLSIPGQFETVQALASTAAELFLDGLPLDRYQRMIGAYASLSEEAARRAAEQYLVADAFRIVLVGDPHIIRGAVEALNLGPVREVLAE